MLDLRRVLSLVCAVVCVGGPLGAAPALAQSAPAAGATASNAAVQVTGVASDDSGARLPNVTITFTGPSVVKTQSTTGGAYSIAVPPGLYTVTANANGFTPATESDFIVAPNTPAILNVTLARPTFNTLTVIGRTSSRGNQGPRSAFNTSPASQQIVTQQTFIDQGQLQVRNILNETPGVFSGLPPSVNPASPGAITFPQIRGALSFETAALIDGHPLSVSDFGDYVTSFTSPFAFSNVELIKGPGAASPEISRAVGGTVNFRTLDPTARPTGMLLYGVDSFGGSFSNFRYSNTFFNGKLGVVADYAINGTPGPAGTTNSSYTNLPSGYTYTDSQGNIVKPSTTTGTVKAPGQSNSNTLGTVQTIAYGAPLPTTYTNKTELLKARYAFSNTTSLTASVLASQTWSDQNGNNGNYVPTTFTPPAGYTGALPGGQLLINRNPFGFNDEWEINNEPITQLEFRTGFNKDNILARYYHAAIIRDQSNGASTSNQSSPVYNVLLFGQDTSGKPLNGKDAFGQPYRAFLPAATAAGASNGFGFASNEEDNLNGYSFEYDHPFHNDQNLLTFAADVNHTKGHSFNPFAAANSDFSASVPSGDTQDVNTFLLRGQFQLNPQFIVTAAYYLTNFGARFGSTQYTMATATAAAAPYDIRYTTISNYHSDGRIGIVYRADPNTSLRFSAGSAVTPPYLSVYSTSTRPAMLCTGQTGLAPCPTAFGTFLAGQAATDSESGANVKPETSFGYDFGGDFRLPNDPVTAITFDLYRTNLFNQFVSTQYQNGTFATAAGPVPLFTSSFVNISNARYEGLEAGIQRSPRVGFGYVGQFALIRGYAYNVPPGGYPGKPGVVNYLNFSDQSVSNTNTPYSQGYFEMSYRTPWDGYLSLGATYYGANNGFDLPATAYFTSTLRLPIFDRRTHFQITADNLFNQNSAIFPTLYNGSATQLTPVATSTNTFYASTAKNYGPRTFRFFLQRDFGPQR